MRECLAIILILIIGSVHGAKITVGPEDADNQQIQQAIDNASIGDIIEVHSGNYMEHLSVTKALTLSGIDTGKGLPVVDAGGSGSVLMLMANGSTVEGFNLTGSGGCGCGNAGLQVLSGNNTIRNNILYKNKFGVYIHPGYINNTFIGNDLKDNEISAWDQGGNHWNGSIKAQGIGALMEFLVGKQIQGNHYSDYDEAKEGCNDTNSDGICDQPKKIEGGSSFDAYPN